MSTDITENHLIDSVLKHGPEILDFADFSSNISFYKSIIENEKLSYPCPNDDPYGAWMIPNEYENLDIESFLHSICPHENKQRLIDELKLYKKHDMIPVLKAMKFLVDKFRENHIVWGVGRGSSVASYTLFLIGVHKIDSVKYCLQIDEFFKGEK